MSEIILKQGDCLELMKDIPNKSVDMILCDLPYGTTQCKWDTVIPFEPLWEQYERIIKDGHAIVLFGSEPFSSYLRISNPSLYKYDWVWDKGQTGNPYLAKKQPMKIHECISVFNSSIYIPQMVKGKMRKKGGYHEKPNEIFGGNETYKSYMSDLYYPKSIIYFSNADKKGRRLHPTQKPVPLLEYLIKTYTNEEDVVLDNCMGSGSTGVACVNLNRNFIGIELDKNYFNIAEERIRNAKTEKE